MGGSRGGAAVAGRVGCVHFCKGERRRVVLRVLEEL